jgi:hypothetical protein
MGTKFASGKSDPHAILSSCSLPVSVMRVCSLPAVLPAAAEAPLSAAFRRTTVLPNPASLPGDDASAARYTPQRTRASNEALN